MIRPGRLGLRALTGVIALGVVLLLSVQLVAPAQAATTHPRSSSAWRTCTKTFDGVKVTVLKGQRTATVVNQTSKTRARVSFWVRTNTKCSFTRKLLTTTARIGYGGTVPGSTRKQGSGTTPLGTYTMTQTFGNGSKPSTAMPYHRVAKGDYWVGDNRSRYYNSLRNKAKGGFRWSLPSSSVNGSENLRAYGKQYRYAVVINFNRAPQATKRYRGSGIFLHVKGSGATAGCVAITSGQMKTVMRYLESGDRITIAR